MTDSTPPERRTASDRSRRLVERARNVIPGGAQTGLRAQAHWPDPAAFEAADGATLRTADGAELTDYHLAFGPIVLGHNRDDVDAAARDAADDGVLYGAGTTELEVVVAERLVDLLPSVGMVNFCNSGSEATYHAIRLARAHTGKETVVKFEGCYHGWHDYVDVSVHPGEEAVGEKHPESEGMLDAAVDATEVLPFNDPDALRETLDARDDVAAVVVEPVPHSVGCLRPTEAFVEALAEVADRPDVALVFDEVITAFRHSPHGMQDVLGVDPDLTCVAKAMGNGYPVAAVGGRRDLLERAGGDNTDGVVISGTYSGHPIGLGAARATLDALVAEDAAGRLASLGRRYRRGLRDLIEDRGLDARVVGYRSIFSLQFGATGEPRSYADVAGVDGDRFRAFAAGMRERGHFVTPNPYKRHHLSLAHDGDDLSAYLDDADEVLGAL